MIPIVKRSPKRKILLTGTLFFLVIGIAALTYIYILNGNLFGWSKIESGESSIDYKVPTEEQKNEGISAKEAFVEKHYPKSDANTTSEDAKSVAPKNIDIIISSTGQSNELLQIRTILQTLNPGHCKLTMEQAGLNSINRTVETQNLGSYSTCSGFDIPMSELQKGNWNVTIEYMGNNESGGVSQKIEVQ